MINSKIIIGAGFFIFLFCGSVKAGVETTGTRISGDQIIPGATKSAQDNNPQPPNLAMVAHATGRVIFSIDQGSDLYVNAAYTVKLGLQITSLDINSAQQIINTELIVNYDPAISHQDKSVYVVDGSHSITAEITYVHDGSGTPITPLTSIPQNLSLEVEQSTERYYYFDPTVATTYPSSSPPPISKNLVTTSNELEIYWDVIPGAEEYELEWTYVNDYKDDGTALAPSFVSCNFRDNSTRVRLSGNYYRVSLIFDQGYVVYRVRGVGRSFTDLSKELFGP